MQVNKIVKMISKGINVPNIDTFSMFYEVKCASRNFELKKALKEIQENLKSKAIWYIFGPYSNNFKNFSRAHFMTLK